MPGTKYPFHSLRMTYVFLSVVLEFLGPGRNAKRATCLVPNGINDQSSDTASQSKDRKDIRIVQGKSGMSTLSSMPPSWILRGDVEFKFGRRDCLAFALLATREHWQPKYCHWSSMSSLVLEAHYGSLAYRIILVTYRGERLRPISPRTLRAVTQEYFLAFAFDKRICYISV